MKLTAKTPPEQVRKEWVRRLRSGTIKQTRGHLGRPSGSRCCLGVLCDMAVEAGIIDMEVDGSRAEFGGEEGLLLPEVGQCAGAEYDCAEDPRVTNSRGDSLRLTKLNDASHKTFKQIADYIEKWWVG